MTVFANTTLELCKSVKTGDKESLLSLFGVTERFKRMDILENAAEGTNIKVIIDDFGEANLKLGDDMEKGQKRNIMTLFWFVERSKPLDILKNVDAGTSVNFRMEI